MNEIKILIRKPDEGEYQSIMAKIGDTLLNAINSKFKLKASCGGFASCATCSVLFDEGVNEEEINEKEIDTLEEKMPMRFENARLSCQVIIKKEMENMKITILKWSLL